MFTRTTATISKSQGSQIAPFMTRTPDMSRVSCLTESERIEVLGFLSVRPVYTVVMTSFISDNGIESDLNRGKFYGYRNTAGTLAGGRPDRAHDAGRGSKRRCFKDTCFSGQISRNADTSGDVKRQRGRTILEYLSGGVKEPRLKCVEELFEVFAVQNCEWKL